MAYQCKFGNHECDGCGRCEEEQRYFCPVCGEEVFETIFVSNDGDVIGCENCAQIKEPCDMLKTLKQMREDAREDDEYQAWKDEQYETYGY